MDNLTAITLPEQNGKYILTEDAVEKIKHADYLSISFETKNYKRIEENCWLRACFTGKIPGTNREVEARFQMPINVSDIEQYPADWEFKILEYTTVSAGTKHAMLGLIKPGAAISFRPKLNMVNTGVQISGELIKDEIFWQVKTSQNTYEGLFAALVCTADSDYRLIRKTAVLHTQL